VFPEVQVWLHPAVSADFLDEGGVVSAKFESRLLRVPVNMYYRFDEKCKSAYSQNLCLNLNFEYFPVHKQSFHHHRRYHCPGYSQPDAYYHHGRTVTDCSSELSLYSSSLASLDLTESWSRP
jgi:hypothetical protein